ncbi:MAG TPA: hydrogenase [Ruminococcus sp.]|nr:hydrogenase [Ruminococcus sp.]
MINITDKNKKDCCGCTACMSACPKKCISMVEDNEGFKYPVVNMDLCVNCGLCEKVCPIINTQTNGKDMPNTAYVVRNNDPEIVKNSTSGGAVTAFCEEILSQNGIIFGGAFDKDFNVCHSSAETVQELSKFRSSKYVQSDLGNTFSEVKKSLDSGRIVMFSGTPCQVEGLKNFLRKPYDNLFTVDFVCRAVPSPYVWKKYREYMESKFDSKITYANFREKTYGYHSANLTLRFANGKKSIENTNTDYMLKSFFDGICSRPSCYDCKFRKETRVSDLTVFDCWDITRYVKDLEDDDKGYTAVIIQSHKGAEMLKKVSDKLTVYPADVNLLFHKDGHMAFQNPQCHKDRKLYFEMLNSGITIDKAVKKTIPVKTSRKIFGKFRGILYKTGVLKLLKKLK